MSTLLYTLYSDIPGILRRGTVCRWDNGESVVVVEVKNGDVTIAGADHYARTLDALDAAGDYERLTLDMLDATTRAQVAVWILKQVAAWTIVSRERNYSIVLQAAQDFAEMSEQQIDTLTRLALLIVGRKA